MIATVQDPLAVQAICARAEALLRQTRGAIGASMIQAADNATQARRAAFVYWAPPNFGRATVEKLAVNAVMAGCRPEYFPVVPAVRAR